MSRSLARSISSVIAAPINDARTGSPRTARSTPARPVTRRGPWRDLGHPEGEIVHLSRDNRPSRPLAID